MLKAFKYIFSLLVLFFQHSNLNFETILNKELYKRL